MHWKWLSKQKISVETKRQPEFSQKSANAQGFSCDKKASKKTIALLLSKW